MRDRYATLRLVARPEVASGSVAYEATNLLFVHPATVCRLFTEETGDLTSLACLSTVYHTQRAVSIPIFKTRHHLLSRQKPSLVCIPSLPLCTVERENVYVSLSFSTGGSFFNLMAGTGGSTRTGSGGSGSGCSTKSSRISYSSTGAFVRRSKLPLNPAKSE